MKIAVTGREGQVVSCLIEKAAGVAGVEIVTLSRPELDLARPETIAPAIEAARPDIVVSAAAYTAVDKAEDEPDLAFAVNGTGAGKIAEAAARLAIPVIHLSTDYVFDGTADRPYVETDTTAPKSVYGASKLAGEQAMAAANPRHLILRTAWVYSAFGNNFVKTMLRLAQTRDEIGVVSDQWGNPTSAHYIADAILHVAQRLHVDSTFTGWGVYHLAGLGDTNWSGFARHILDTSGRHDGPHAIVRDITTSDYPTKARRPANSRLSSEKFSTRFGWAGRTWQEAVDESVARIIHQAAGRAESAVL